MGTLGLDIGAREGQIEVRVAIVTTHSVTRGEAFPVTRADPATCSKLHDWAAEVLGLAGVDGVVVAAHDSGGGSSPKAFLVDRSRLEGVVFAVAGARDIPVQLLAGRSMRAAAPVDAQGSTKAAIAWACAHLDGVDASEPWAKAAAAAWIGTP